MGRRVLIAQNGGFRPRQMFAGFSCRPLDVGEEWLSVDYQISCMSDEYLAFAILGIFGVLAFPIGVPTTQLIILLKNGKGIRSGQGPEFERYMFLVADYKPR